MTVAIGWMAQSMVWFSGQIRPVDAKSFDVVAILYSGEIRNGDI